MKKSLHRFGKFYSSVILNFIGIFIFVGIISVVFGDCGWMPNENIYAISQFAYSVVIPVLIAYAAGNQMRRDKKHGDSERLHAGGAIAVMAAAGMILADSECGILGAMILGPLSGMLWEYVLEPLVRNVKAGMEMLIHNLVAAFAGSIMAILAFYLVAPLLSAFADVLLLGMNYLIEHKLIWLLSILIEPAKVFFLNNSINHGMLLPLGVQQAEHLGESILFLLETNPGPGLGMLGALYIAKKEKRKEYAASMFVEFIGGVHEIYFPEVLSNMWLLLALICGGAAGNFCFLISHGAVTGAVSPGSILSILLVCSKNRILSVLLGVFVSAAVSVLVALMILKIQNKNSVKKETGKETETISEKTTEKEMIAKIGFVCNAGVGSSAMGAALFRRKLREMNISGIEVEAYPADQIPDQLMLIVCQKDFQAAVPFEWKEDKIYTVESLLNQTEYEAIIEEIQRRGKEKA